MGSVTVRFVALVVLVTGVTACGGKNEISPENQQRLIAAITTQVPGTIVDRVSAGGDGFTQEYTFSVSVRSNTADAAEARVLARQVSRVAWHNAEASSERINVSVALSAQSGPGCHSTGTDSPSCRAEAVAIPSDAARRLWGAADHGDRPPSTSGTTFVPGRADGLPQGWQPDSFVAFTPNLTYHVIIPPETTDADVRSGVDLIAAFLWHEHPDRLAGITVEVIGRNVHHVTTSPTDPPPLVVSFTAEQLRARFGPRASDLDR